MRRSASESSWFDVPGCLMQVPPLQGSVNAATGTLMGPVRVEFAGVVQLTEKRQTFNELLPKLMNGSGVPDAGRLATPSRSAASPPPYLEETWNHPRFPPPPANLPPPFTAQ